MEGRAFRVRGDSGATSGERRGAFGSLSRLVPTPGRTGTAPFGTKAACNVMGTDEGGVGRRIDMFVGNWKCTIADITKGVKDIVFSWRTMVVTDGQDGKED